MHKLVNMLNFSRAINIKHIFDYLLLMCRTSTWISPRMDKKSVPEITLSLHSNHFQGQEEPLQPKTRFSIFTIRKKSLFWVEICCKVNVIVTWMSTLLTRRRALVLQGQGFGVINSLLSTYNYFLTGSVLGKSRFEILYGRCSQNVSASL